MEKLKIHVKTDSFIFKNKNFITFTFKKNNLLEKYFLMNEQSNISNIKSESEYLYMLKALDENFLNLKQYKLEFFKNR